MTEKKSNIPSAFKVSNINEVIIQDDEGVVLKKGAREITFYLNDDKIYITAHNE